MFGVFVVAQFWAFAADLYSDEQGRRLIPMVAIGATAGAAVGSWVTETLVRSGLLPAQSLLLAALVPLLASLRLTRMADSRGPDGRGGSPQRRSTVPVRRRRGALGLVFSSRFLIAVAVITLLTNWVNTNGENLLFRVVEDFLERNAIAQGIQDPHVLLAFTRDGTTAFYGNFFFWVNIVALLLQSLVASRLLKYGGFGTVLLFLPVIALMSYSIMALVPILAVVKVMKIAENASDYSINNTARNVLWLPATTEMKYKGKPIIDTLFARLGDGLAALTVLIGVHVLTLSTSHFFAFTVALVVMWFAMALVVFRQHARLVAAPAADIE